MNPNTNPASFSVAYSITFRHTDAAGISFFANVYPIAHDVFEKFVVHLGFEWREWFDNEAWGVPLRHSSCDYFKPLRPGNDYDVNVVIEKIGETSLTLRYDFMKDQTNHCSVRLVHTFVDKQKRIKTPIPSVVRDRLEAYGVEGLRP